MHIISTQRFRLPVRRYIIDLFSIEMNSELVSAFMEYAQTLKAGPVQKETKLQVSQSDMFANLGSGHDSSTGSDEDESDPAAQNTAANWPKQALTLRPVHKVVGFNA
jgi:rapamycin-insensitive companion of mTOR